MLCQLTVKIRFLIFESEKNKPSHPKIRQKITVKHTAIFSLNLFFRKKEPKKSRLIKFF